MKLKKIKLENIRSYDVQEVTFPEGSLLLSGNIGSGKSSILLGIDFALFGLQRGTLDGNAILRNGTESGSVELLMEIDNKLVEIKRNLKRTSTGVVQKSGHISIDNNKQDGTPVELKDKVLQLLNYPRELLTKNKSLIYRYTVYTPQEQMKQILLGKKEDRLETLRKVFGIDKYKRIKDNTKVVITKIKEKRKFFEGETQNLSEKESALNNQQTELILLEQQVKELEPLFLLKKQELERKQEETKENEASLQHLLKLKKDFALLENNLKHLSTKKQEDQILLNQTIEKIGLIQNQDLELKESYKELIETNKQQIDNIEKEIRQILNKKQEFKVHKANSLTLQSKIQDLDSCPTCQQEVSITHKESISRKQEVIITEMDKNLQELETKEGDFNTKITTLKQNLENLTKREAELELIKHKLQELNEKKQKKRDLEQKQEALAKAITEINNNKTTLEQEINKLQSKEELFTKIKSEKEVIEREFRELELKKASLEAKRTPLENQLESLKKEIMAKRNVLEKLSHFNKTQTMLEQTFIPTLNLIEKSVMFKVHEEFNSIFIKWLTMLIDTLNIGLDEEFTPKIQQNGYDIDYEYLSGGEKTAVALAYRLALNQVINRMMVDINTKGLLILDEPTDGFSSEQLDKVKDLINELEMEQIVLVSHETSVESFVDNIVRLEKQDHSTQIV
tara:strand:- start:730 stop:2775 length:2046 start_codon:yes stop_codon:yes gene_type:complete